MTDQRKTLIYTTADGDYEDFATAFIFFGLSASTNHLVEIGVRDKSSFCKKNSAALNRLRKKFLDRLHISEFEKEINGIPGATRFINTPECLDRAEYCYIADIDIMIMDEDLSDQHLKNMSETGQSFSNIIRTKAPGSKSLTRLSGLHFCRISEHFPLASIEKDLSEFRGQRGADEHILYLLVSKKFGEPSRKSTFRPLHGIHLSPSRRPVASYSFVSEGSEAMTHLGNLNKHACWDGIEEKKYQDKFLKILSNEFFRCLFFDLPLSMQQRILTLRYVLHGEYGAWHDLVFSRLVSYPVVPKKKRSAIQKTKKKIYKKFFY